MDERFPILGTRPVEYIPWAVIEPHEQQAMKNHGGQSLQRLAERGGLDWVETLAVLEDMHYDAHKGIGNKAAKLKVLAILYRL